MSVPGALLLCIGAGTQEPVKNNNDSFIGSWVPALKSALFRFFHKLLRPGDEERTGEGGVTRDEQFSNSTVCATLRFS